MLQVLARPRHVPADNLIAAAAIYNALYALPDSEGGGVSATFQIVSLSGWVPDSSQPKAKTRGSAGVSLKDLVDL
jgi:NADH dehydrogenase [ubiquinone] 1 alpha subcomplex assembly factor 5